MVCGTLVAEATRTNIQALRQRDPNGPGLRKYAEAAVLLTGQMFNSADGACDGMVDLLAEWTDQLSLPRLSDYGMTDTDLPRVVANCRGGSMQTNPLELTDEEIAALITARL